MVSNDAGMCAAMRRELSSNGSPVRVAAVSSLAAARRILEEDTPSLIFLEENSLAAECGDPLRLFPSLEAVVASLAVHAPVVVLGPEEKRAEVAGLIDAGVADYVTRKASSLTKVRSQIQRRLRQAQQASGCAMESFEVLDGDFGEVLRHELNNPLTGILGNAELLLTEIHRTSDGRVPHGAEQRLETIAGLAVRMRETVRRLSQEWETRQHPVP